MRKTLFALSAAIAVAMCAPASAQPVRYGEAAYSPAVPLVGGAAVGTAVGVGLYEGWLGTSAAAATLPTTAAGSAVIGGVAGVGTVALIDAAIQPCSGFHALVRANPEACANGQWVGYQPVHQVVR